MKYDNLRLRIAKKVDIKTLTNIKIYVTIKNIF